MNTHDDFGNIQVTQSYRVLKVVALLACCASPTLVQRARDSVCTPVAPPPPRHCNRAGKLAERVVWGSTGQGVGQTEGSLGMGGRQNLAASVHTKILSSALCSSQDLLQLNRWCKSEKIHW